MKTGRARKDKYCPHCDQSKSVDDFYSDKSRPDGRCGYCKKCCSERASANYLEKTKGIVKKRNVKKITKESKARKAVKEGIIAELNRRGWDAGIVKAYLRTLERDKPIYFEGNKKYNITPDDMKDLVWAAARSIGTTPDGIMGRSKMEENVIARSFVCKELYERGVTYYTIGKLLGGRQKGHIKKYVENISDWIDRYNHVKFDHNRFKKLLNCNETH